MSVNSMILHNQWRSRPADERFVSLEALEEHANTVRDCSKGTVVSSRKIEVRPSDETHNGVAIYGPNGVGYTPTHWAFGQLATLAGAPAGYLRTLPSELVSDNVNFGLHVARDVEDVGILLQKMPGKEPAIAACTGPDYGRIWDAEIVSAVREATENKGGWGIPGYFGSPMAQTKENSTLYLSDRDSFMFLADETAKVEVKNRRAGLNGTVYKGFFLSNSIVGSKKLVFGRLGYDGICGNRIIWGMQEFEQLAYRHTAGVRDRWLEKMLPAIKAFIEAPDFKDLEERIAAAQKAVIDGKVNDFFKKRFGFTSKLIKDVNAAHLAEEGRPIETLWDAQVGVTAHAKSIVHQDERLELEVVGGKILQLAA